MRTDEYDVAVVGSGVAASAALLALGGAELSVAVVSPRRDAQRDRIGEHLSSAANPILARLGLWESFQSQGHVDTQSSYSAWGTDRLEERHAITDPRGAGWSLDRPRFERWLAENAGARCPHHRVDATVTDVDFAGGSPVTLGLKSGDAVRARFVLDASGRRAVVASQGGDVERSGDLVATYRYFDQVDPGIVPTPGPMVESRPHGWLYSAVLPGRRLVAAWFTDRDLLPPSGDVLADQVLASRFTRLRLETAGYRIDAPATERATARAAARIRSVASGERWAAAGDAASSFDPLSSHGLATALWSGEQVGRALVRYLTEGDEAGLVAYAAAHRKGVADYRVEHARAYAAERRFETEFWRRRVVKR